MDVDPGLAAGGAPRYVEPNTGHYLVSGGPVIDEDVDMDMVDDVEPAPAPAVSSYNNSSNSNSRNSTTNDSIYASRYAHDYGPVNYVGKKQQYHLSRYSNDSLTSTPLPRDKYGEELKPPSSSAGRLEEQRRNKQQQQPQQYNHARHSRDGTIWSSAYAPR